MRRSMESLASAGNRDVIEKAQQGVEHIKKIGDEFKEVKSRIADVPPGIDADLWEKINHAQQAGEIEARNDIELKRTAYLHEAKRNGEIIKDEVNTKLRDNGTAISQLEGIKSSLGRAAINAAKHSIEGNSRRGNDILSELSKKMNEADNEVNDVINHL